MVHSIMWGCNHAPSRTARHDLEVARRVRPGDAAGRRAAAVGQVAALCRRHGRAAAARRAAGRAAAAPAGGARTVSDVGAMILLEMMETTLDAYLGLHSPA